MIEGLRLTAQALSRSPPRDARLGRDERNNLVERLYVLYCKTYDIAVDR